MPRTVSPGRLETFADDITECEQWVCWRREQRDGEYTKVPITPVPTDGSPYASCTDPATWGDCRTALEFHRDGGEPTDGIGYVFTDDGPLVGVDLDDCRDPTSGAIDDWAHDVVTRLDSYTEVSPSGTGLHVLVRGTHPGSGCRASSIEMYDDKRYFTVTGEHLDQTPRSIEQRQAALETVHEEYIQTADDTDEESTAGDGGRGRQAAVTDGGGSAALKTGSQEQASGATAAASRAQVAALTDEELLQRARAANDGGKFTDLWRGQWQAHAPSQSEADLMLACKLAFWTGGDVQRMDRLFRHSGLMRPKWDETHYVSGETYGEMTLARAVAYVSDYYTPNGLSTKSDYSVKRTVD